MVHVSRRGIRVPIGHMQVSCKRHEPAHDAEHRE